MRVTGEIDYQLEHGEVQAGLISAWTVPYSAWLQHGHVAEIEADGLPRLIGLTLKVGPVRRPLDDPSPHELRFWLEVWCRDSHACENELQERFVADCLSRHEDRRAVRAA